MTEQHHAFDAFDRQCEDLRDKWLRHRAKPEVWAAVEKLGKNEMDMLNCVLEPRTRVEALEADRRTILGTGSRLRVGLDAAEPAESNYPAEPDSSLVERVHSCIVGEPECGHMQARAAIREVAAWLRSKTDLIHGPQCARWLEQELNKPQ